MPVFDGLFVVAKRIWLRTSSPISNAVAIPTARPRMAIAETSLLAAMLRQAAMRMCRIMPCSRFGPGRGASRSFYARRRLPKNVRGQGLGRKRGTAGPVQCPEMDR